VIEKQGLHQVAEILENNSETEVSRFNFFGTGPRWPKETHKAVPNLPHRSEKMLLSSTAQQDN
jgi:hypothetical protein